MLFSLIVALMVILIAAFWAYQGFFSSIIMFFESVLALFLAFGYYEQVHGLWAASLSAGLGLPLAFIAIFAVSLVVLRLLSDRLIPDDVRFNLYLDRAGGAIFGFFTGMILVGASLLCIQMLPIGSGVLGFERLELNKTTGQVAVGNFLFKPDAFVVGLANMASGNDAFGESNPLRVAKPDLLMDLYSARAGVQPESRMDLPPDCLKVLSYSEFRQIDQVTHQSDGANLTREFATRSPEAGRKFLVCRVQLDPQAADKEGGSDIRFRPVQFRLVGPRPAVAEKSSPLPRVYLACGMSDLYTNKNLSWKELRKKQDARLLQFNPTTNLLLNPTVAKAVAAMAGGENSPAKYYEFDVVFEVPDEPDFKPWYIEFKRGPRVELTDKMKSDAPDYLAAALVAGGGASKAIGGETPPAEAPPSEPATPEAPKVGKAPKGRTNVASAIEERTGAISDLPIPLDRNDSAVAAALKSGKLGESHFVIELKDRLPSGESAVKNFYVPEGKRLLQIGARQNIPESLFGKALNYASTVTAQVRVTTDSGEDFFAVGVYSSCVVGGKRYFEIQYHPEAEIPERALKQAKKLTNAVVRESQEETRKFGFIFLVNPNVKIVSLTIGRTKQDVEIKIP